MTITDEKLAELETMAARAIEKGPGSMASDLLADACDPPTVLSLIAEVRQWRQIATDAVRMAAARGVDVTVLEGAALLGAIADEEASGER